MSGDLQVTTAQLRELAAKQGQAAAEIRSATEVTGGVDTSVRISHGVIADATAHAIEAAANSRHQSAVVIGNVSASLGADLTVAASRYDDADGQAGSRLGGQVHVV